MVLLSVGILPDLEEMSSEELMQLITDFVFHSISTKRPGYEDVVVQSTNMTDEQLDTLQTLTLELESREDIHDLYNMEGITLDNCFNTDELISLDALEVSNILYRAITDPAKNKGQCYALLDWSWFKDNLRDPMSAVWSEQDKVKIMMIYSKIRHELKRALQEDDD